MAGYTKADYDAAYSFRVERMIGGGPTVEDGRAEVRVHYHKWAMQPILAAMWARLAPILNIASSEHVCIVGAGFGWGVDAFIAETGATTVGIDISDYISAEQSNTEETELRAAISAVGLDPDSGRGAVVLAEIYDAQPRSNVIVLQEDAQTNTSRQAIRAALNNNWPSVVIMEDLIDANTTDQEITQVNNAANLFAGAQRVIWITSSDQPGRTLQELQTLTGSEVITRDGLTHLVP